MTPSGIFGVQRVPVVFVNAYLVDIDPLDRSRGWVLVDTGLPGIGAALIARAAAARYGANVAPEGIVLTHGHFDHAGSARALARRWGIAVYAHHLELPYLTGQSSYPPADPTVGGALAMMSRAFPRGGIDLRPHALAIDEADAPPFLDGWRVVHTPGHTAGHISLLRETDGALLAGDALATMNQESWIKTVTTPKELSWPPAPLTTDWPSAMHSVRRLADLHPSAVAAGHGLPIAGDVAASLNAFAAVMSPPAHGRYVRRPAIADETGVVAIPPPAPDPLGTALRVAAAAALTTGVVMATRRMRRA
jgi:glyoxylase-like metal-dependent hydrolase (beta-lactamase superfamily II)